MTLGVHSLIPRCFNGGNRKQSKVSSFSGNGTRILNLSDKPVELQVKVGSALKKVHSLKSGSSKKLEYKTMYETYVSDGVDNGSLLDYCQETCQPYIWIHDPTLSSSPRSATKQHHISLQDLRDCSEIRIFRDHLKGCVSVRKKPRMELS
ncbi:uncharacterized protein LOC124916423 [Impatiens glandulifera]|uniref:uncharacterized protein LOC124916423 n=1 Tax=Impatiens glandulifera TaxID=253017 RepID=UPI001FB0BE6C|nr:uncharacterized protein LOC124916423 [Impatiens glandulifera]